MIELSHVLAAQGRIQARVHRTPLFSSRSVGESLGVRLHLKAELFQKTGSFKVRGVLNRLLTMEEPERAAGLISLSAGNHAAALAWAATTLGTRATIVMPARAVPAKIAATRSYGGDVVLTEENLLETCLDIQRARGLTLVHPFDDPWIMAGQGTIGLEILDDLPSVEAVIVPVGGGGLIGGIAAALKGAQPKIRVIGVEPVGADGMSRSLAAGRPVHLDHTDTIADGLAAPFAGQHTLQQVQRDVDEMVRVEDSSILRALRVLVERAKLAAEPAGAAALAALLAGRVEFTPGTRVVCVVSGGNLSREVLAKAMTQER